MRRVCKTGLENCNALKQFLPLSVLILLALSGCKINFEANAVVSSDGSVVRNTRYIAYDDSDKKEVEEKYTLPEGGTWKTEKGMKYNWRTEKEEEGTIHVYEVSRKYAPGNRILSDHVRKGKTEGRMAQNQINMSVHNYFFVKYFDFTEVFRDISSKEKVIETAEKLSLVLIDQFATRLESRLNGVSKSQANDALKAIIDPWFNRFIESIEVGKAASFVADENEVNTLFEKESMVKNLIKRLPPPSQDKTESRHAAIAQAYEEWGKSAEAMFEDEKFEEIFWGVYGFVLFQSYGFKESLSLPGEIISTNATSREGNVLTWDFDNSAFRFQDYILHARSKVIRFDRLALGGGVALIAIMGFIFSRRRENKKL